MGDILSHTYDLYDDYTLLCNKFSVKAKDMRDRNWLKHFYQLEEIDEKVNKEDK